MDKLSFQPITVNNFNKIVINKILKIITILILVFSFSGCFSQHLMKTVNDARNIKENQSQFINKPLKDLLKEIKPQIKCVTASPSINIYSNVGYFIFNFIDYKQKEKLESHDQIPVTIVVYVKENFDWDFKKRPKGKEMVWTEDDAKKYENLTIVGFRIYGNVIETN
jgi:hypothetical protein